MVKKGNVTVGNIVAVVFILSIVAVVFGNFVQDAVESDFFSNNEREFKMISSTSNEFFESALVDFAKKNKIDLTIDYYGDLEIVDMLNSDANKDYDGVWISNSIWLYMLDNSYLVSDSKSVGINPVVMAVTKSKAEALGFTKEDVRNVDILNAIRDKKLNYVMASVTKTNTGATAYLGFLNSLAGSPEVLSSEMLKDEKLVNDLRTFFQGVERVSGDEAYLEDMFLNGNYDAIIDYESSLINMNRKLISEGKEPLYLVYPLDGVAINDMPFGFIDRKMDKKDKFEKILEFLRSEETAKKLESEGIRTWYGGVKSDADVSAFKKEWGINTDDYLIPLKYPGKKVITEALDVYIEQLRKPTHTVFCLDVSGSMSGSGIEELKDAMSYILDREKASKDRLQFSSNDKITILAFNAQVQSTSKTYFGDNTGQLINYVDNLTPYGGTNIYSASVEALKILEDTDSKQYTKTVILMTDGESNSGSLASLKSYYSLKNSDVPIYSIRFGESSLIQLTPIAEMTNAKVFNGKNGLKKAFQEVRSYN